MGSCHSTRKNKNTKNNETKEKYETKEIMKKSKPIVKRIIKEKHSRNKTDYHNFDSGMSFLTSEIRSKSKSIPFSQITSFGSKMTKTAKRYNRDKYGYRRHKSVSKRAAERNRRDFKRHFRKVDAENNLEKIGEKKNQFQVIGNQQRDNVQSKVTMAKEAKEETKKETQEETKVIKITKESTLVDKNIDLSPSSFPKVHFPVLHSFAVQNEISNKKATNNGTTNNSKVPLVNTQLSKTETVSTNVPDKYNDTNKENNKNKKFSYENKEINKAKKEFETLRQKVF